MAACPLHYFNSILVMFWNASFNTIKPHQHFIFRSSYFSSLRRRRKRGRKRIGACLLPFNSIHVIFSNFHQHLQASSTLLSSDGLVFSFCYFRETDKERKKMSACRLPLNSIQVLFSNASFSSYQTPSALHVPTLLFFFYHSRDRQEE